jgi:hypothetical protein
MVMPPCAAAAPARKAVANNTASVTSARVTPSVQLIAVYCKDVGVDQSFKEDSRFNFRLMKAY